MRGPRSSACRSPPTIAPDRTAPRRCRWPGRPCSRSPATVPPSSSASPPPGGHAPALRQSVCWGQDVCSSDLAPGAVLLPGGLVAERLIVVVGGAALLEGLAVLPVFDARSTLFGLPVAADYRAGPDGAETLSMARPHLFTIARECPDFIVGLAAARGEPA